MKHFSKAQLSVAGQLARKAHRHLQAVGCPLPLFDEWRHEVTARICSASSWKDLVQTDYVPLCNYFRAIIGVPQHPDRTPKTDEEALMWTIRDRLTQWEASPAYIAAIVRDKTGLPCHAKMSWDEMMAGLPAKTLLHLLYTFEARLRAKSNKSAAALGVPSPAEVHISRSTMPPARLAEWRGDEIANRPPRLRRGASRSRRGVAR